jgi:flagellar motor switch protein FliG
MVEEADMDAEPQNVTTPSVKGTAAAAITMLLLDEAEAAAVLKHLDPDEIKTLGKAMFAASNATITDIQTALGGFTKQSEEVSAFSIGVEPRIRGAMTQALGNVRADNILAAIAPQASAAVLDLVRWMERPVIARILAEEHPQVAAIVLSVLTPDTAAVALEGLDEIVQADLIYRAARLSTVSAEAIAELELVLATYANTASEAPPFKIGGKSEQKS